MWPTKQRHCHRMGHVLAVVTPLSYEGRSLDDLLGSWLQVAGMAEAC